MSEKSQQSQPPYWHAWRDVILSTHPQRRAWVGLSLLALAMTMASILVLVMVAHTLPNANIAAVHWWAAITAAGMFCMTTAVRFGWSASLRNPALTQPQMVWALTSGAVIYVLMGEAHGLVPGVMAMILFFGTFDLSVGKVIAIGVYALAAFLGAIGAAAYINEAPFSVMDTAYSLMVVLLLSGSIALNLRIQRIRQRLNEKRHALSEALRQNRELASRDELTGLINRRTMVERMGEEHRRSLRNGRPLLLALLDIDHFKRVNDTYGHATGDQTLKKFAQVVSATARGTDVLARWGGEEFVLMATDTQSQYAFELLERIRQAVASTVIAHDAGALRITVSSGLAQQLPGETVEHTLERADKALYTAKLLGRNRVAMAPTELPKGISAAEQKKEEA